jgi:hypothetical protein
MNVGIVEATITKLIREVVCYLWYFAVTGC